ncbi:glycine betaine ABC transporter substrate-binding protein [Dermacoccus sp. 147Ba]|uniref:glycine betaine ABC transporter substrate-binding protein n=1 Tax=Dermacoccus sp. 147Ba TaxID=2510111 RepID=UPI00101D27C2|nr:glycine betaine ABC transporter substrate-binding protein [Dermacoccus sp. 147Ba]RYI21484.1 glycine betaine ABC transporter substrate-binding protein [Dermacoccus sp. 147Ba]
MTHKLIRTPRARLAGVAGAAAAGSLLLSSCGLGTSAGISPSGELGPKLASVKKLDGAEIAVGSKQFTEQQILGKIAVILLQSAGGNVKDFTTIPGSAAAREAQIQGQTTFSWEYTGTAWITYMGHTKPIPDPRKQFDAVKAEDAKNGLTWLQYAPMNNTYGFAAKEATAKKFNVKSLSDLKKVPKAQRTLCVDTEFANRDDGLEPMLKAYGIPLGSEIPRNQIKKLESGAIYAATNNGLCNFGEVFTTDGRIKVLKLQVLADDKKFFPLYNVAPVFSTKTLEKNPQLSDLFGPVSKKLTNETMIELNAKVDVDGENPSDVAFDWLKKEGFIK